MRLEFARRAALVAVAAAAAAHRWPLAAAQPSPPPAAFDEPWFLGAARQGLEALCCGGMPCLEQGVFPLQCSQLTPASLARSSRIAAPAARPVARHPV